MKEFIRALRILALICFALAAIDASARVNLVALGLFLWLLSQRIS